MSSRVLIVEPDPSTLSSLLQAIGSSARAEGCTTFPAARRQLVTQAYDRLITNLRLQAHNGLHLVYLARSRAMNTRAIVYTHNLEVALAHEVQESGAFYESLERLRQSIGGYLQHDLPASDRRDPTFTSRRATFRGGRRYLDQPVHAAM
jgi:DNA-binding NtrC family response regulator